MCCSVSSAKWENVDVATVKRATVVFPATIGATRSRMGQTSSTASCLAGRVSRKSYSSYVGRGRQL